MSTISDARLGVPLFAPLDDLRAAGIRTSLFQGCAYAAQNSRGWLFQLQAVRTGPGDVEDLFVHRFRHHPDGTPKPLTYSDSMLIKRGGHVQAAHVRISAAGNPYLWLGLERYDRQNVQTGADLYRVRYQPGKTITARSSVQGVQRVYTGDGNVSAVGCPAWTIVLRRAGKSVDLFQWFSERALLDAKVQQSARNGIRPVPVATIGVPKFAEDDDYQSSHAQGKWSAPGRVYRATGAERVLVSCSPWDDASVRTAQGPDPARIDLTAQAQAGLRQDLAWVPGTEPEGLCTIGGRLHVAVQTGTVSQRRIAYFPASW